MNEQEDIFNKGSWIVHQSYGVGQIQGIETRNISGEEALYYHLIIKTTNSHIWIPVDKLAEDARPVSTPAKFQKALAILERPPHPMDDQLNQRTKRITSVRAQNSPTALARLLRDLWARQKEQGILSQTETNAMRRITERFLGEWSVCMGLELAVVEQSLLEHLQRGRQKAAIVD
jgi:CarD family transcriptional regulator